MMMGSAESNHHRLTNREIILEVFKPICDYDTSTSQENRRLTVAIPCCA